MCHPKTERQTPAMISMALTIMALLSTTNSSPVWDTSKGSPSTFIKPAMLPASSPHSTLSPELLNILRHAQSVSMSSQDPSTKDLSLSSIAGPESREDGSTSVSQELEADDLAIIPPESEADGSVSNPQQTDANGSTSFPQSSQVDGSTSIPQPSEVDGSTFNPRESSPGVDRFSCNAASQSSNPSTLQLDRSTAESNGNLINAQSRQTLNFDPSNLSQQISDRPTNSDQMPNIDQNTDLSQGPVQNVCPDPVPSLKSIPIAKTPLSKHTTSAITSPPAPKPKISSDDLPSPFPSPTLLPIQPLNLSPKCTEELIKLLSNVQTSNPSHETVSVLSPLVPNSNAVPLSENHPLIHCPDSNILPSTNTLPFPSKYQSLDANVLSSPTIINKINNILGYSEPDSNSNSSLATAEQNIPSEKANLNLEFVKYLTTLPSFQQSLSKIVNVN